MAWFWNRDVVHFPPFLAERVQRWARNGETPSAVLGHCLAAARKLSEEIRCDLVGEFWFGNRFRQRVGWQPLRLDKAVLVAAKELRPASFSRDQTLIALADWYCIRCA